MWIISKTSDRRVKWAKIWDLGSYIAYVGYPWCLIPWVWFGVIQCNLAKFFILRFSNRCFSQHFSSDPIQTLWEHCLAWGNAAYYSSWKSAKFYKIYGTFEILTLESMGKPKMCSISKTDDCRVNQTKIWDSGYYICRLLLMPDSLNLVWGHSVHFAKFPIFTIFKTSSHNFHPIHPKLYARYPNHGQCRLLLFLQSAKKKK